MEAEPPETQDLLDLRRARDEMAMANSLYALGLLNDKELSRAKDAAQRAIDASVTKMPIGEWLDHQLNHIFDPAPHEVKFEAAEHASEQTEDDDTGGDAKKPAPKTAKQSHKQDQDQGQSQE